MPVHNFDIPRGRVEVLHIESKALEGNLLGDPTTRAVAVYLPEGYDTSGDEYPLIVSLAPFSTSGFKQLAWQGFGESLPQQVDRLVASGAMGPVVLALPDAFTKLGGNQYINSAAVGRWEDFLIDEMLPALEAKFRIRKGREHRGVFGRSSGGYAALVHGMRHADVWAGVASHSGDVGFDVLYRGDFPKTLDVLARHDYSVEAFVKHLASARKIGGHEFHAMMILAMAATYDPDPSAPYGVRLPVDLHTAELDETRWRAWLAWDPLHMVDEPGAVEALQRLRCLYVDCGSRDQYYIHYGSRALSRKLTAAGVDHVYEEFPDNHSGTDYRFSESLPRLYQALC